MILPKVTRRAVIDVGRKCNAQCKFCYHSHLGNLSKQKFETEEYLKIEIDRAYIRECNYIDFTGGEPTILPFLPDLIKYALDKYNMKSCVITNGLCGLNTIDKLIKAGVDDFLLSVEGLEETHDEIVQVNGASKKQEAFLKYLQDNNIYFRINTVINKFNQNEIRMLSEWYTVLNTRIVNFINFNPHHGWKDDKEGTRKIIADLPSLQNELDAAINILESSGIGVNVRYFPMCRISEQHRKNICNDLHVVFDPYEWEYCIIPKTPEKAINWAISASLEAEYKRFPCSDCSLLYICGGVNKSFYEASEGDCVFSVNEHISDRYYFYKYRQENILTLEERAA